MRRARGTGALVAVAVVLALTGCSAGSDGGASQGSVAPAGISATGAPAPPGGGAAPADVVVPSIGARSTLVPLGLNPNRTVQVPPLSRPEQAGWFTKAPMPGQVGPAVILGHVNGDGKQGVFAKLAAVKVGDPVLVRRVDGSTVTFAITQVKTVPKASFPTEEVYGNTTGSQLRLITCGGALDREAHSYESNVIAFATETGTTK
jgi:LPXTG-site transpeptidase (sortase) family protein